MNDDRLTPEERAVIDAAQAWRGDWPAGNSPHPPTTVSVLRDAVDAYRATQDKPPTLTGYLGYYDDSPSPSVFLSIPQAADRVWRCHIIPVERVR